MKKFAFRALALVLCLLLSVSALAEGMLVLPAEISAIRAEAFMGDESMTEAVIPEGARAIGERAFAYSALTSVTLPATLTEIADNAFEGCDGLTATVSGGSYAHQYCVDNNINYRLLEELYSISSLMYETLEFRATVSTDEICVLRVEVLKEDSETVVGTYQTGVAGGLDYEEVSIRLDSVFLPNYYILRAVLLDGEGNALCEPFVTMQYTEAYAQFDSLTQEDYADEDNEIIDFGDCGFGVVADGAIVVPGTSSTDDHETFVIPGTVAPKSGDIILVTLPDGTQEPVKVDSVVRNTDGTSTVVRDPETVLSDLYEVFKLDGVADVGAAAQNNGVTRMQRAGDGGASTSLSTGFTYDAFSVNVTGMAEVTVKAFYNAELFGDKYIEQQLYIDLNVTAKAAVTKAFKSSDIKDAFGNSVIPEFVLYEGPISLIGAGSIITALQLKISIPLEFSFSASGEYTLTITQKTGYSFTTTNGYTAIKERDADQDFKLKGSFNVQFGPKIELKAIVLLGILEGGVSGQVGIRAQGTAAPNDTNATGELVHGCSLCCDIDLSWFAEVKGNIEMKVTEKLKWSFLNVTLISIKQSLGKAYLSIFNDEDSLFGGELTFDFGKCPNYKVRVKVDTQDCDGSELTGIPVVITKSGTERFRGDSPCVTHLYPGDYNVEAMFDSVNYGQGLTVQRSECDIVIKEPLCRVIGTVKDEKTGAPISGADVKAILSDGNTRSAMTDSDGVYYFDKLLPGIYSLTASAANYAPITYSNRNFEVFTTNSVNFSLQKMDVVIEGVVTNKDTSEPIPVATVTALLPDGTTRFAATNANGGYIFEYLPEGEYTLTANADGYVSVTHSSMTFVSGSTNAVDFELKSALPDEEIMMRVVNHMGADLIQQLKDVGLSLSGNFYHYVPTSGDSVLYYTIQLRGDYSVYSDNKELFIDGMIAVVESEVFPLTEDEIATAVDEIKTRGRYVDYELDNGFRVQGAVPINDVAGTFTMDPRLDNVSYTREWRSQWIWDVKTYDDR